MTVKKTSLRSVNILLIIVIISIILMFIVQFNYIKKETHDALSETIGSLSTSFENRLQTIDKLYYAFELSIDSILKDNINLMEKAYLEGELSQSYLESLKEGQDYVDLYAIDKNNIVVMSTYEPDLLLDFSSEVEFSSFLDNVRDDGSYFSERVLISNVFNDIKKYVYFSTFDDRYILEASYDMSSFEDFLASDSFGEFSTNIIMNNDYISDLVVYNNYGDDLESNIPIHDNSDAEKVKAFKKALDENIDVIYTVQQNDYEIITKYIPYTIESFDFSDSKYVLELTYSTEPISTSLKEWFIKQSLFVLLLIMVIIVFFVYYNYFLVAPINNMLIAFDEVNSNNFSVRIPAKGNSEIKKASLSFNKMAANIEILLVDVKLNEKKLIKAFDKVETGYFETVRALVNSIDAKDNYTSTHCEHVMNLSIMLGEYLLLSEKELESIRYGSLLHDIGKIGIEDQILNKPGVFTDEEYTKIKEHPQIGYDIVKNINFLSSASNIILSHHERIDGTGYPNGLKGNQTPYLARIIAITDAFDAMTSQRIYKEKIMTVTEAFSELTRCSGTQFDKALVNAFIESYCDKYGDDLNYIANIIENR